MTQNMKSNTLTKLTTLKTFEDLPKDLKNKIEFLLNNPDAKIVKLSDPQRGSTSSILYGLTSNIDAVKPIVSDALNFKIPLNDHEAFFKEYAEYGASFRQVLDDLKKLDQLGISLLKNIDEKNIRNKRIKLRVYPNSKKNVKSTNTNKTEEKTKEEGK